MLARCPTCRNTFSTDRSGRQDCPHCGKPLVVPEPPPAAPPPGPAPSAPGPAAAPPPPEPQGPEGTPWERRQPGQAFAAWRETMVQALFEPGRLYAQARLDRPRDQLSFALWTGSVFWMLGQLIERFVFSPQQEQMRKLMEGMLGNRPLQPWMRRLIESANQNSPTMTLFAALLAPLFILIFLYLNAGVTHLFALLLGQNKRGWGATFAACAYSMAPFALFVVPGCGALVAIVWCAVLVGVGIKHTHGTTAGGAAATALSPYVVFCCAACGLTMLFASLVARGLGTPG